MNERNNLQHLAGLEGMRWRGEDMPERLAQALADPKLEDEWLDALKHRLKNRERDAVRIYAELRKWIGTGPQLALLTYIKIGAQSEDDARARIGVTREWESMTDAERARSCVQFLLDLVQHDPTLRAELKPLFSAAEEA